MKQQQRSMSRKFQKHEFYQLFWSGVIGVNCSTKTGIIVKESIHPRIWTAIFQINADHNVNIIVAYALTLIKNEQDPQVREDFECINTKGS